MILSSVLLSAIPARAFFQNGDNGEFFARCMTGENSGVEDVNFNANGGICHWTELKFDYQYLVEEKLGGGCGNDLYKDDWFPMWWSAGTECGFFCWTVTGGSDWTKDSSTSSSSKHHWQYIAGGQVCSAPGSSDARRYYEVQYPSGQGLPSDTALWSWDQWLRNGSNQKCICGDQPNPEWTPCPETACAAEQYVSAGQCVDCPAGTTNAEACDDYSGEDTTCDITYCAAEQYVSGNECTACPAGTTNVDGNDDASGADTSCDITYCAADQFVSGNVCTDCPAGTTNPEGDDASGADTSCEAIICPDGTYVSSNTCVACSPGQTGNGDNDASGGDTTCVTMYCLEDEYVSDNMCTPCAPGTTNAEGEAATSADTSCDITYCAAEQFVSANVCTDCPAGTTNVEGNDDASGADTSCVATLCDANQYVSANVCTNCDGEETNEAGDDASGADTACAAAPGIITVGEGAGSVVGGDTPFGNDVAAQSAMIALTVAVAHLF